MPEVAHTRSVDRPLSDIWAFVQKFDNWAPMLQGYEGHVVESDEVSVWTLRGELGPFSRAVRLRVTITTWDGPHRVAFRLDGLDEAVTGEGAFDLSETRELAPAPPPRSWWTRLLDLLLRRPPPPTPQGAAQSTVRFRFLIDAQGPVGPMVNAMLGPYTDEVARGLLERVGSHLEAEA